MNQLLVLGGGTGRTERTEDGVRERREERGGGQGGGRDDAEVRARSEDGRETESREERGESQDGGGCSFVFKPSQ